MARRRTRKSSLVYSRYLLWLRAGRASPSFSHDRTMEADTPKRWATAPTFSASPIFLAERGVFFLRPILDGRELEDALDKGVSTWPPAGVIICFLSIAVKFGLAILSHMLL